MKRTIVTIDEAKCTGCGACVAACAEGALALVDGKARLVKETFCDGFGDCIGDCPTGALKIEVRESEGYDPAETRTHVRETSGEDAVARFDMAALSHTHRTHAPGGEGGCPGSRMRFTPRSAPAAAASPAGAAAPPSRSELEQWPVQLHLVAPGAPFFRNRDLVVLSTCSPVACPDVHARFVRGRGVAVGCPKLDDTAGYAAKLGAILAEPSIPKVIVVRMTVPCCGGLTRIVQEAVRLSGRPELQAEEVTIGLSGEVEATRAL